MNYRLVFRVNFSGGGKGSFDHIESVDFKREIPAATQIASDEETGGGSAREKRAAARPLEQRIRLAVHLAFARRCTRVARSRKS